METDILNMKKLVITAALVGGVHGKEVNPNIPCQPDEIAQSAYDCVNAGASVIHIHVRDRNNNTTGDISIYNEVLSKIRSKVPKTIIQVGNGFGVIKLPDGTERMSSFEERLKLLEINPPPDMLTINGGTFTFAGKWNFFNPPDFNEEFCRGCLDRRIPLEVECYDISHIYNMLDLYGKGLLPSPIHFSFVTGVINGIAAHPKNLMHMLDIIPEGSMWQVIAVGRAQMPMITMGIALGGNVRLGLEDNVYSSKGVLAKSSAHFVERVVNIAKSMGREISTLEESRQTILGTH
jgi:3-keto-5-aminohexanoate cleavage enzyme